MSGVIQFFVELSIKEGKTGQAKEMMAEAIAKTKEEAGVLSYQFYFSDDGRKMYAAELYKDVETLQKHFESMGDDTAAMFEIISIDKMTVLGDVPDALKEAMVPFNPVYVGNQVGFTR